MFARQLAAVERMRGWNDEWVAYEYQGSPGRVPVAWTTLAEPDPFLVVAAQRSPFHINDLLRLAALIRSLES